MSSASPSRRALHERNNSQSNVQAIRLVPSTPPQLLGRTSTSNTANAVHPISKDEIYTKSPLQSHPNHILGPIKDKTRSSFTLATPALAESFHNASSPPTTPRYLGASDISRHALLQPTQASSGSTSSQSTKRKAPAKKRLQIHKDGRTFSLLRDDAQAPDTAALPSPLYSPVSFASFDSLPSYASNTEPRTSIISNSYVTEEDSTLTTVPGTPPAQSENKPSADPVESSPWNYSLVGGVRKVPKTPDSKQNTVSSLPSSLPPLPTLAEVSSGSPSTSHDLNTKLSFQSTATVSTVSATSNYKTYRTQSLPKTPAEDISFAEPNHQVTSDSSPDTTVIHRPQEAYNDSEYDFASSEISRTSSIVQRPQTANSEANYEVYGNPSSSNLSLALPAHYSHESLLVPALKPRSRRSHEKLGYYKSRSRESLRSRSRPRTGSITSLSTILSQREALKAVLGTGLVVNHLSTAEKGPNSWAEPSHNLSQTSYMNEQPHQWSSQLSTVMSVSDGGSGRNSRTWSEATGPRSSRQSRGIYSIGSSSFVTEDRLRADLPAIPQGAHVRGQRHLSNSSVPIIESQDEYGDGITDMRDLRARPSRRQLSGYYAIEGPDSSRTNTMRSTSSSLATMQLANSLPTWARLYYGSGEHSYLGNVGRPGSSTDGSDSRLNSMRNLSRNGSPIMDNFQTGIYSPRKRPRDTGPHPGRRVATGSMDITPVGGYHDNGDIREGQYARGFRTWSMSSVWSPHLRLDRRAQRQSVWQPPSVNWSTEGRWFGRRNVQVIMFIVGFIFPFAWMIAALLPLPPRPLQEMQEQDNSTSNLGVADDNLTDYERQMGPMDEARYESAKWWRQLNRWMSLVGAIIIAVIIVLIVVSLRQGW